MTDDIHDKQAVAAIRAAEDAALKALQVVQHARAAVDMAYARRGLRPVDLTIQTDADVVRSIDELAEHRGITRSALLNEWIRARLLVDGNG
jgi:Ribbon-helix-helix protein, copG family